MSFEQLFTALTHSFGTALATLNLLGSVLLLTTFVCIRVVFGTLRDHEISVRSR